MLLIFNEKIPNLNSGENIQIILINGFCGLLSFFEVMLRYYLAVDHDYFLTASSKSANAVILTYDSTLSSRCS